MVCGFHSDGFQLENMLEPRHGAPPDLPPTADAATGEKILKTQKMLFHFLKTKNNLVKIEKSILQCFFEIKIYFACARTTVNTTIFRVAGTQTRSLPSGVQHWSS